MRDKVPVIDQSDCDIPLCYILSCVCTTANMIRVWYSCKYSCAISQHVSPSKLKVHIMGQICHDG